MNVDPKNNHQRANTDRYRQVKFLLKSKQTFDDFDFMDVQNQEIPDHLKKKELIDYYAEKLLVKAKKTGTKVRTSCPKLKAFLKRNPEYLDVCI